MSAASLKKLTCVDFHGKKHQVPIDTLRWRPSVYAIVLHDDKLLLTRQVGTYIVPGGGMEFGETPEEAVTREVQEETGIQVTNPRLVACRSNLFKSLRSDNVDDFIQAILLFYVCDYGGGKLSITGLDEHERTWTDLPVWLPVDQLDSIKAGATYDWRSVVKLVLKG